MCVYVCVSVCMCVWVCLVRIPLPREGGGGGVKKSPRSQWCMEMKCKINKKTGVFFSHRAMSDKQGTRKKIF